MGGQPRVRRLPAPPARAGAAGARYIVVDHNPEIREQAAGIGVRFVEAEASRPTTSSCARAPRA
jgi:hypothetical protein